jgi:hypothetical protein
MRRHNPKQELSPIALKRLKARIWGMPWVDKTEILIASLLDREKEVLGSSLAMTAFVVRLAEFCGDGNKIRIAEALRNSADVLDHKLQAKDDVHVDQGR